MRKKENQTEDRNPDPLLRDEAEGKLAGFPVVPDGIQEKTFEEVIHELQIHQIELEMQNEELRKTQVALEESRERYADLYHFAPVGYFTFTPEALIKEVNLTGSTLLGVARQNLINTRFRKIVTAKDQDLWDQHFLSVLREGEKQTCDLILKRPEGSPFYAGLESIRMEAGRGAFLVHTTVTDITERKRLEAVIRQSEERYRTAIIEEIDEGYYEVDLAGNFTFVNDSMTRLLLYSREDLIGMNYRAYIPREEVDGVYKTFNRVYRTGEIIKGLPAKNIRKDGTPIFTEESISCRRDKEGRIIGFRGIVRDVSERKRAEQALNESEIRFRTIFESSKDGIIFFDGKTGKIILANSAMAELLGCPREDLIGRAIPFRHPPEEWVWIEKEFQKHLSGEVYSSKGIPILRNDGSVFFADISSSLITLEGKTYFSTFFHDITERKQAEEALRRAQEELRAERDRAREYVNIAGVLLMVLDKEGRVTLMNRRGYEILGYEEGELVGKDWFTTCLHGRIRDEMAQAFRKLINGDLESLEYYENTVLTKQGEERTVAWHNTLLRDEAGNITGSLSSGEDITERKRAEEDLKKAEEKYRNIFENAIEGIFQITPDGRYLSANAALAHMLGYNAPEELIRSITDIENQIYADPDCRAELRRLLESQDKVEGVECPVYRKDGQIIWISINMRAVRNEKGELLFYEGTNFDINEKKSLQTEIMQADRLSTIGELAAGVAHEINNPINGIINYAQMLIDRAQDPGEENDIPQRIIKEGERIATIVNNLLKFAKDRREKLRPIPIQTPLNGVLELVGTQMKKDGIRISVKLPPDLPQVLINSQQIQQVFLNLLSNTRYALNQKYPGDHPGKTLTVSGKKIISEQGRPQIRLNFRDAGTGIPKAFLDKIFNPFFTTKLAEKGTGLGLSISRKIIQDHGGRLWLESREGKYTIAIVELPAAEEK